MSSLFKSKLLAKMSLNELKKRERLIRFAGKTLSGLLGILLVLTAIYTFQKGYSSSLTIFLAAFSSLGFAIVNQLKKVKTEISSRA